MSNSAALCQDEMLCHVDTNVANDMGSVSLVPLRSYTGVASYEFLSRSIDLFLAIILLVCVAPLMALIALLVMADSRGPILFKQTRIGHGGRFFACYKFRTMRLDAEAVLAATLQSDPALREEWDRDHKLRKDPRLSRLGSVMRRTSLDELPQLFNILRGEMSIVGPRPITTTEVWRYGRHIFAYYSVRPGLTGLWQVSGRSKTTYRRRIACDVAYARSRSPFLDLQIIARTVPVVLFADGAY